jgi:hypothetical protein
MLLYVDDYGMISDFKESEVSIHVPLSCGRVAVSVRCL